MEAQEKFNSISNFDDELRVLFLLGKFWYMVGDPSELEKIINQFEYYSYTKSSLNDEHLLEYEFMKIMMGLLNGELITVDQIISNLEKINSSNSNSFGEIIFHILEQYSRSNKISDTLFLLKHPSIKSLTSENIYLDAYSDYTFGSMVRNEKMEELKSPLEYFDSAFSKLENESINELTWKVLLAIAEIYTERGNYHKAKKPRLYALELINLIADSITNTRIRLKYLEKKDRKEALELLKQLSSKVKANEFQ